MNDPELYELVKTYQVQAHSRTCWKYNKNEFPFLYGRYFTEKTIIKKLSDSKFNDDEKKELLTWRNMLLRQAKSCIDNNLNKVNVIDPTKDNFTQPLSLKEIMYELELFKMIITEHYQYQKLKISICI